jgi:hypothetical protein
MNNAGLPGTGLGGLFYVLLAVWMPVAELNATLRGRSSRARWRQVGTQFALACGIIAAVSGTVVGYLQVVGVPSTLGMDGPTIALAPVVLAALLLSGLVAVLRVWSRLQGPRNGVLGPDEPVPTVLPRSSAPQLHTAGGGAPRRRAD